MSHRGSLLCLPGGMHGWEAVEIGQAAVAAGEAAGLRLGMFEAVIAEAGAIAVLLIGTGPTQVFLTPELREALAAHGLHAEAMATGAAARTYNVLLAEKRAVAAALIAVD
ncbi:MAG: hypothetical protein KJ587_05025 [Alphaproteobacteria bacterium]|nr:hypothetical protein [Alphaproteobacteria bacterium]